jgi:hypothetical protein
MRILLRGLLLLAYAAVVVAVTATAVLSLTGNGVTSAFLGLANKTLTFITAGISIVLMEAFYAWRYKINAAQAFDRIEADGRGAGLFLGLLTLGLCILAGAIYGSL